MNAIRSDLRNPHPDERKAVVGLSGAGKVFGGTIALQDASFELRQGEVLALLGENGAGKSTCVKLLAGVLRPDSGHVAVDGQAVDLRSPLDSQRRGIAVMHQHPGLFGDLSVAENIFIGHRRADRWGRVSLTGMLDDARDLLQVVGLQCDPATPLNRLRSSEQQLVEIARALSANARVLIMDEPTATLSHREVDRLFKVVGQLRDRHVAMMFVGHRMDEIYGIADRVAVLRDGRVVADDLTERMPRDRAVQLMVGRPLADSNAAPNEHFGETVLEVSGLSRGDAFQNISFTVREGEVIGLAGLVGSGRTEIARVLFGIDQASAGQFSIDGAPMSFGSPHEAMQAGVAYVSEDRIGQSLVADFSILTNASLPVIDLARRAGLINRGRELSLVREHLDRLKLRFRNYEQPVRTLSGGNQQKVVLSKWLATHPRLLILDEPTQGVDVQTKAEVHAMIAALAREGMAIVLISSELPELLANSNRIIVLREGKMTAKLDRHEATQERILYAATDAGESAPPASPAESNWVRVDTPVMAKARVASEQWSLTALFRALTDKREVGLVIAILAIVLPVFAVNPRMLGGSNLDAIAMDAALLTIVAVGQMLVIITRNIDLSVASVIGLAAYVSADLLRVHPELGVGVALFAAGAVGLLCGLLNGWLVTVGRVPAIVVTLGTLSLYRGMTSLLAGGRQIGADQVPQAWLDLTSQRVLGIPGISLIALVTLLFVAFILRSRAFGRDLFAIGSNPGGARLIGIRVDRRILAAFACSGLLAGFDGGLWASRYATVDSRVAFGFELTVVAAVVIGGVAVRGGSGSVLGVALGALALLVIRNGLILVRVDPLWLQGVYGLVILVAITIDALVARRSHVSVRSRTA
ncbi:ATP-binding cassette domain-containing protein [Burkholderia sp. R-69927]|nr:ATP-binding cassette domain-containing protein [Burkholderia sp. R-69927]